MDSSRLEGLIRSLLEKAIEESDEDELKKTIEQLNGALREHILRLRNLTYVDQRNRRRSG